MANEDLRELNATMNNLIKALNHQTSIPEMQVINDLTHPASTPQLVGDLEDWQLIVFDDEVKANDKNQFVHQIPLESHFDLIYITGRVVKKADRSYITPDLELKIIDGGSDRHLTKDGAWVHWQNVIGSMPEAAQPLTFLSTPNAPYTIAGRRRFPAGTSITLEIRSFVSYDVKVQVVLHGIKMFTKRR